MSAAHILVMDSGIGGLSVTQEVRRQLPGCRITYVADLEFFPYGVRPEAEIVQRVSELFARVHSQAPVDIAVIACNTASTVVLETLRAGFPLPIVGVVPAIKPAAKLSRTGCIGLLATEATVNRPYTRALIEQFAGHCRVLPRGSRTLVQLAEQKLQGYTLDPQAVATEVGTFAAPSTGCDTVVLACTHFPLIRQELMKALPHVEYWVDSGEAIARRVVFWAKELKLTTCESALKNRLIVTGDSPLNYKPELVEAYLGEFERQVLAPTQ